MIAAAAPSLPSETLVLDMNTVLSRARVGVLHRDLDDRVLSVNERYCEIVGRTADQLSGLPFSAFTHPDDLPGNFALHEAHRARGEPFEIEKRYIRPDGTIVWCAVHCSFVPAPDGTVASTITVAQDITARRLAEEDLRESEEHYRNSIELSPQISWTATPEGLIDEVSPRWRDVTGEPPEAARGEGWLKRLHPDDLAGTLLDWAEAIAHQRPVDVEYRVRTARDGYRWFRARAAPRVSGEGRVLRWYGTLEDIDDRRGAEQGLRDSEARFRLAAQTAGIGIWDYDAATGRREWSDEFKTMLGLPLDAPATLETAAELIVPEDRERFEHLIGVLLGGGPRGRRVDALIRIHRADTGEERWIKTGGLRVEGPAMRLGRILVTVRDATEEYTAEQRIRWAAMHDPLTGLPNRLSFTEALENAIARAAAEDSDLALVLFDVDHLKETNDTIGHAAGDELLRRLSERLQENLGRACTLGRLGGDEFAAIVENVKDEKALAARVRSALRLLRDPFQHEGRILDCQATAGVSVFPRDGADAAELLKAADMALYSAKAGSRGGVNPFRPVMRAELQRRFSMITVARDAIADDRIRPFYQPKVALQTGRIVGFEALLRWHDKQGGIHLPGQISAAFEDFDVALMLSDRMFEQAIADMRRWQDQGIEFGHVAVNVSPAEFRHDHLADRILDKLHRIGVPGHRLQVEVTESVLLGRGADEVGRSLEKLSREGVGIALDDFGTGFASLTHLKAYPVDTIKIDRSFVSNLGTDPGDAAIAEAVIRLGHRLGMRVVAEGIETAEQAEYLLAEQCDHGQGFLYSKAVAFAEASALLADGARIDLPRAAAG